MGLTFGFPDKAETFEITCKLSDRQVWANRIIEPHHEKICLRGFLTREDSNQPAQLQKLARILKLCKEQVYISYYLSSEQQRR